MKRLVAFAVLLAAAAPAAAIGSASFNQLSRPSGGGAVSGGGLGGGSGFTPIYNDRGVLPAGHIAPVPEPGEWAMMTVGLAAVGFIARRRKA